MSAMVDCPATLYMHLVHETLMSFSVQNKNSQVRGTSQTTLEVRDHQWTLGHRMYSMTRINITDQEKRHVRDLRKSVPPSVTSNILPTKQYQPAFTRTVFANHGEVEAQAMSGWNAYVDTQLVATGAVCQAGIFGKADMQCYANAGDFQVWK